MGFDLAKKRQQKRFLLGIVAATLVMIADWMTGALGPNNQKLGHVMNSEWVHMADWRFIVAAVFYAVAIPGTYMAAMELINISRSAECWTDIRSRRMGQVFRTGIMGLVTLSFVHGILRSMLPAMTKLIYGNTADLTATADIINKAAVYTLIPATLLYLLTVLAISASWIFDLYKKKLNLPFYGYLMNPAVVLQAGWLLRCTGVQFFVDFTAGFNGLGWLLLFYGAYLHTLRKVGPYIPQ